MRKILYTIGHSTRDTDEFLTLLQENAVGQLVDVRSMPGSRRYPHFNQENLSETLNRHEIEYRHIKALGGRRKQQAQSVNDAWKNSSFRAYADYMQTQAFQEAFDELLAAAREQFTAMMCAEVLPWRCHRWLIADVASARGWDVQHIMNDSRTQAHKMTSFACVEQDKVTYPFTLDGEKRAALD